jgi:tetratricopeptide (TPR) repeat protein
MKSLVAGLLFLIGYASAHAGMEEARVAYDSADYAGAAQKYEELVGGGAYSFALFYNLGNCYLKQQVSGMAILNYEKALILKPGNDDARHNLDMARALTLDQLEYPESRGLDHALASVVMRMPAQAWVALFVVCWVLAALTFGLWRLRLRKRVLVATAVVLAILSLPLFGAGWMHQQRLTDDTRAVILEPSVRVHAEPSPDGKEVFTLHEGAVVDVLNSENGWLEVQVNDNVGWILETSASYIKIL